MPAFPMPDLKQAKMRLDIYLAEYDRLKSEQVHRIGIRDNLVYASLVATAAVVAFAFDKDGSPVALLVLPLAGFVLGWLHTSNDAKSCAMGCYLREILSKRIHDVAGVDYPELTSTHPCLFGWENEVRTVKHRRWRKLTELVSNIVTFLLPGALALPAYWWWLREDYDPWLNRLLLAAVLTEGVLLVVLGIWLLEGADIRWRAPKTTGFSRPLEQCAEVERPDAAVLARQGHVFHG